MFGVFMSKVVPIIPCLDPDNVLESAKGNYKNVLLLGWNNDGEFDARAGGGASLQDCQYFASLFAHKVLNGDYFEDETT